MGSAELPMVGACLCGSVRVTVTAQPLLTMACHCGDCQKLSAGAFTLTVMIPHEGFACRGDLVTGGLGTQGRVHYFCKSCLNFIYSQVGGAGQRVNLRCSVLADAAKLAPFIEVMTDEKLPWVSVPVAHSFARYPASLEDLGALMQAYAAR